MSSTKPWHQSQSDAYRVLDNQEINMGYEPRFYNDDTFLRQQLKLSKAVADVKHLCLLLEVALAQGFNRLAVETAQISS